VRKQLLLVASAGSAIALGWSGNGKGADRDFTDRVAGTRKQREANHQKHFPQSHSVVTGVSSKLAWTV
jgi:hypothetical protein